MSLFKARDWWSTSCGSEEEFDKGCLCVGNIDNSSDESAKIIVGSYGGFLRIYKPQPEKLENGCYSGFRADEMLLEAQLSAPILQVQAGLLVSATKLIHLAVLHPLKISVYRITAVPGTVEHGTYYNLSLVYEHILQRHAFAMILGPFGGIQGREHICVQSLDGTLNFFEQESFAFSRYLPNAMLPGPITYALKTDSFVTVSCFCIESYRFQVLAVAKDENSGEGVDQNFKGKRVGIDWSLDIGESALEIKYLHEKTQDPALILVLGERTLFGISASGVMKFTKRFNFSPSCMMVHNDGLDSSPIISIATTNQTVLVYHVKHLKWAAQLPVTPVCMQRSTFMNVRGLLVLLSAQGNLACCYLGTEPSAYVSPLAETKVIDFEEAETEMQQLKKMIREANQNILGSHHLGNEIHVSINMPYCTDTANTPITEEMKSFGYSSSVTVKVQLKSAAVVHDVRLMIHVEPPLKASQTIYTFASIVDYSVANVTISVDSQYVLSSLQLLTYTSYISSQGTPRVCGCSALLPFSLVARACHPSKSAEFKVILDLNKKAIPSSELFSDLSPDSSSVVGGAMGIEYHSGHQVTIVPSKSAQRYRLQSDSFSSLWLVVSELVRRLKNKYRKEENGPKVSFQCSLPLPLQEYFGVIEDHFSNRQQLREMEILLGQRAEQFRVVQKRLLTKMKDKTPTPLNNLDTLLEATHRHILTLTDSLAKQTSVFNNSCCALSSATQLILLLLKFSVDMKDEDHMFISSSFSPDIDFDSHQGWEERVDAAVTYLLKFCIGTSGENLGLPNCNLEMPKDLTRLRKHIFFLFDQLVKNVPINVSGKHTGNDVEISPMDFHRGGYEDELMIPIGCKFADTTKEKKELIENDTEDTNLLQEYTEPNLNEPLEDAFNDYPEDEEEIII